ncbi:MAG: pyruvate kinase [Acidimicrobiales bacterium]
MSRRAKIICTLGPATPDLPSVRNLVTSGMDVARLNLSHGNHDEHARRYEWVRQAGDETGRAVAVLADLQGPKIRLGTFSSGRAVWTTGDRVVITTEDVPGTAERVSTTYVGFPGIVHPGDSLLVDDGNLVLEVIGVEAVDVACRVVTGGNVSDHKSLSLPGIDLAVPALTDKDLIDLRFALKLRVDMVALSFVRQADDAKKIRQVLRETGSPAGVIAKVEKPQAVSQLSEIVAAFDAIMIARGDLGVETPLEQVPLVQKRVIRLAREAGKPVIVATQMLESMITLARPTRAEASDVATAVFDGADALMLSGETSVGANPRQAVDTMARIIEAAESEAVGHLPPIESHLGTSGAALAAAAIEVATDVQAAALVAFTQTGATARRLARARPVVPILAFTPEPVVRSQLALSWGVETFIVPTAATTDGMVRQVDEALQATGRAGDGDRVVIVAGTPPGQPGSTNTVRVHRIGDAI